MVIMFLRRIKAARDLHGADVNAKTQAGKTPLHLARFSTSPFAADCPAAADLIRKRGGIQ